ncbi:hypothetical protein FLONG3_3381 [Fusarium longipes]|uniref:Uncharacterized protein n=1 Tax=Fusarium longipes TaxID=694270 RepID=A0A395T245_9HYPO|nr:hypothetical protein FLONG3_3381 [Fusarium longipes]
MSSTPINMDRLAMGPGPSIKDFVKSIRQRNPRSACISREIAFLRYQRESGFTPDFHQFLGRYIHTDDLPLALMTYNLHSIPFNPMPEEATRKWVDAQWPRTFGDWKNFQEFIELADTIDQLATIFATVPNPEHHWDTMYSRALYLSSGETVELPIDEDTPDIPLTDRPFMDMIRLGMQISNDRNLSGEIPKDNEGNPIDPEFFADLQRSFWTEELSYRAMNLEDWYGMGKLPANREVQNMASEFLNQIPEAGISDAQAMKGLFRVLREDAFFSLGYLFQLSSINSQITLFWLNIDFDSQKAWYDGWFEKYPVSGPINHASLDIEYLSRGTIDPHWRVGAEYSAEELRAWELYCRAQQENHDTQEAEEI